MISAALKGSEDVSYTCVHKVWGGWEYRRCGKKADDSGLCGRHKPEAIKARKAKAEAKSQAIYEAHKQKRAEKQRRERMADAYPEMLAALEAIERDSEDELSRDCARAAIAKAKWETS